MNAGHCRLSPGGVVRKSYDEWIDIVKWRFASFICPSGHDFFIRSLIRIGHRQCFRCADWYTTRKRSKKRAKCLSRFLKIVFVILKRWNSGDIVPPTPTLICFVSGWCGGRPFVGFQKKINACDSLPGITRNGFHQDVDIVDWSIRRYKTHQLHFTYTLYRAFRTVYETTQEYGIRYEYITATRCRQYRSLSWTRKSKAPLLPPTPPPPPPPPSLLLPYRTRHGS